MVVAYSHGQRPGSVATYTCDDASKWPNGDSTIMCDQGAWEGTLPTECVDPVFTGGQLLTPAMDVQLQAWLEARGLANAAGWAMCYSSPNGHPKNHQSEWHSRCDGHARTVVVGSNQHGYVFGGFSGQAWNDPSSGSVTEDGGHFIFRLAGPALAAEAWEPSGSSTAFQVGSANYWPAFGQGDLRFGYSGALGANYAYCNQDTYQAASNAACGGGAASSATYGLGAWGAAESEMEMWYAL